MALPLQVLLEESASMTWGIPILQGRGKTSSEIATTIFRDITLQEGSETPTKCCVQQAVAGAKC